MNYKYLLSFLLFLIIIPVGILYSRFHLIIISNIENTNIEVKISFKCFFNLINITKRVYPIEKHKKENNNIKSNNQKVKLQMIQFNNLIVLYKSIRKVKISEVYSNLSYGSENIRFTSFIYVLVNIIYGNLSNYFDAKKMYLKVTPCYTKNFIKYKSTIHITPTIKDIITIFKAALKVYIDIKSYKKLKYNEGREDDEIRKFNKKYNGYNA